MLLSSGSLTTCNDNLRTIKKKEVSWFLRIQEIYLMVRAN